jgi:hypothetical protein
MAEGNVRMGVFQVNPDAKAGPSVQGITNTDMLIAPKTEDPITTANITTILPLRGN